MSLAVHSVTYAPFLRIGKVEKEASLRALRSVAHNHKWQRGYFLGRWVLSKSIINGSNLHHLALIELVL